MYLATSRRVARFQNRIVRSDGGGIRNQSELHVIDPNPSLTFSLIGIASTKWSRCKSDSPSTAQRQNH
jgi:hypothetical protein